MWYADLEDPLLFPIDDQFMLGDELLVAPIVHMGSKQRSVYFPGGVWRYHEFAHQKTFSGKARFNFTVQLDQLLYFVKI